MIIDTIPGATRALGKPENWNEAESGPCGTLPIRDEIDASGYPFMWSQWRPDAAELALLNAGGAIQLGIQGVTHPVVSMGIVARAVMMTVEEEDARSREEYTFRNDPSHREQQTPEEQAYDVYCETFFRDEPRLSFDDWRAAGKPTAHPDIRGSR